MIDIFAIVMHWCASCAGSGNVIPGAAGVVGGAAGAVGGLGALTPMSDLFPPGTTANPDGSLSWPNPDGTTSTKLPGGVVATTGPDGTTHYRFPDGEVDPKFDFPPAQPIDEVGGPRTPDELIETLGALTGVEGIAAGLEEGEPVAKVIQDYAAEKLVEEGLKTGSEAAGEKLDQVLEAEPPPKPAEPDPIIGQTGYVANDDGTVTTLNPDGSSSTPNADGSVTTVNPGGSSTTSAPTATPATGSMSPGSSGPSDPDGS